MGWLVSATACSLLRLLPAAGRWRYPHQDWAPPPPESPGRRKVAWERAGSAASLPAAPSGPLGLGKPSPGGGRGGGLRSQHRGALPWKGTKEVRREERGERAWHFSLLEWNTPVLGKTLVGFVPDPPSTVRNMNPFPSCASSFSANLSPKFNINITKNEFFFGWGVLPCLWYKYACAWTFFPVSHLTGDNHSVCDAHPREPKHVHTCIPTPPPPNPLLSPGSALVECLWGVGHRAEKFTLLFFSLKSRKRRQLKKKTLILRLMLNTLFYIDWASHFPTMGQVESRWPRAR